MDLEAFGEERTGRIVPVTGVPAISNAFVPDPLPPTWSWPDVLWPLLLRAHQSLANLNASGKYLPNPDLLLRPLQNREAQKSSSLEGTYTDPEQQLLFGLNPRLATSAEDPLNDLREVFNYATALRARRQQEELARLPLSLRLIRALHEILMSGVRGADRAPGEFRRTQNQIGRPPRYVPPPTGELPQSLDSFEKYLNSQHSFNPLVEAFLVHYQFEAIHPFIDGNGRVGRLLLAITIEEWCGLNNQWLYMSVGGHIKSGHSGPGQNRPVI